MKLKPIIWIGASILLLTNIFIIYWANRSGLEIYSLGIIILFAGLLFESIRVTKDWKLIIAISITSYVLSFCAFIPGDDEATYHCASHFEIWPYIFLLIYMIGSLAFWGNKAIAQLTEGITLLQSIAIIYYIIEIDGLMTLPLIIKIIIILFILLAIFPIYNAFSYKELTPWKRFYLSIYSSIIMLIFAIDNTYRVFFGKHFDEVNNINEELLIAINYFLLGISSIYFLQNLMLLFRFFPGKNEFFNKAYFNSIDILRKEHIDRYSVDQVNIFHSLLCIVFAGSLFTINYYYQFVPKITSIWIVFFTFPLFIKLIISLENKKKAA